MEIEIKGIKYLASKKRCIFCKSSYIGRGTKKTGICKDCWEAIRKK